MGQVPSCKKLFSPSVTVHASGPDLLSYQEIVFVPNRREAIKEIINDSENHHNAEIKQRARLNMDL